jgi:hypothetical protein
MDGEIRVEYTSIWRTPIDVKLGRANAVTYGIVATELVENAGSPEGFAEHLVNRLGIENLRAAAEEFTDLKSVERPPDVVLARRLEDYVDVLASVVRPILSAADAAARIGMPVNDGVRRLIDVHGPNGLHPTRLSRNGRTTWGHRCETLIQRAALEIFELYATNARLRKCIYCGSVFVPHRDERFCQWNAWPRFASVGDSPLRLCSSKRHAAIENTGRDVDPLLEHTRERKRLYAIEARARKAAHDRREDPNTALSVIRARENRRKFAKESPFRRGRKSAETARPDVIRSE